MRLLTFTLLAWSALLPAAGCYRVESADCMVTCGDAGACPRGLTCADGYCRPAGATVTKLRRSRQSR